MQRFKTAHDEIDKANSLPGLRDAMQRFLDTITAEEVRSLPVQARNVLSADLHYLRHAAYLLKTEELRQIGGTPEHLFLQRLAGAFIAAADRLGVLQAQLSE